MTECPSDCRGSACGCGRVSMAMTHWERCCRLVCWFLSFCRRKSSLVRMSALSNESSTMTPIHHRFMIGCRNCTNSTIATLKCACAAAVVASVFVAEGSVSPTRRTSLVASLHSRNFSSVNRCVTTVVFQQRSKSGHDHFFASSSRLRLSSSSKPC